MSLLSKQASFENGSFYVLQNPNCSEPLYHTGELILEEKQASERLGFFTTYDQSSEQSLGPNRGVFTAAELKSHLGVHSSHAELRLNPSFEGKANYQKVFGETLNEMKKGVLKKAVLFNTFTLEGEGFPARSDFYAYVMKVLSNQQGGFLFGFYNPKEKRAYLGVTPEFLCRQSNSVKYTTAVAGTKMVSEEMSGWSEKLSEEHELVKRGISEVYSVEWSDTEVQNYGPLRHLKAIGSLNCEDSVKKISSKLHPTAAVGTLPRSMGLQFKLGDLSNKERGHFGGYVFMESADRPFSLVTIRGLEWSNGKAFVCIGGGVLPQSQLEDEWLELKRKWAVFRSLWVSK